MRLPPYVMRNVETEHGKKEQWNKWAREILDNRKSKAKTKTRNNNKIKSVEEPQSKIKERKCKLSVIKVYNAIQKVIL